MPPPELARYFGQAGRPPAPPGSVLGSRLVTNTPSTVGSGQSGPRWRACTARTATGRRPATRGHVHSEFAVHVQLAARRSLASMTFEAILTNRNQLSEDNPARCAGR